MSCQDIWHYYNGRFFVERPETLANTGVTGPNPLIAHHPRMLAMGMANDVCGSAFASTPGVSCWHEDGLQSRLHRWKPNPHVAPAAWVHPAASDNFGE